MAYDPKAFHARDSAMKHTIYYVKTTGDRWFPTAYDSNFATNTGHNAVVSPSGAQAVA